MHVLRRQVHLHALLEAEALSDTLVQLGLDTRGQFTLVRQERGGVDLKPIGGEALPSVQRYIEGIAFKMYVVHSCFC